MKTLIALFTALLFTLPANAEDHSSKHRGNKHNNGSSHYDRGGYGHGHNSYNRPYYRGSYPTVIVSTRPAYYRSTTQYSSSIEVSVQRALSRRGYYHGPIDGDIGPGSRNAISAFQSDRGLNVTGRINSATVRSLGI